MSKIEIYSSKFCPLCWAVNRLLKAKGVEFTVYSVDGDPQRRREMTSRGSGQTVPQIFVDDRPVGGFDELMALDRDNELDALLGLGPYPST